MTSLCSTDRPPPPTRVSVASDGTEGNSNSSFEPAISADGRFVTYASVASNLVPGDTNNNSDIFVFDRQTNTTERVSVASDGTEANGSEALIPRSRRTAALWPTSALPRTWFPAIPTTPHDVFVFDRQTNTTELVSVASDGTEANSSIFSEILVEISADGRFVVYSSDATNLVPGDTNNTFDIFVFDRQTNTTQRVSVASDGTEGNGFSIGARDFGGWALCHLWQRCLEPGPRRHQRSQRYLRVRPADRHHHARLRASDAPK